MLVVGVGGLRLRGAHEESAPFVPGSEWELERESRRLELKTYQGVARASRRARALVGGVDASAAAATKSTSAAVLCREREGPPANSCQCHWTGARRSGCAGRLQVGGSRCAPQQPSANNLAT